MIIPWTLQRYIFREMGKTFVLTAAVLTGALGLGGGVHQMLELKEATPWQVLQLMALILPVAGALTLPIAALFSAAATYGRLSADNEFIACRSGGINLHVLFLPAVVLGLLSAAITFVFMSMVIPRIVMNLTEIVSNNPTTWIQQRLHRPQGLKVENHRIYADEVVTDDAGIIHMNGVAFVETKGDAWVRYGTARQIRLRFDRVDHRLRIGGTMTGLTLFDRNEDQFSQVGEQQIAAPDVPFLLQHQIKFLTLGELFHYMRTPESWPPAVEVIDRLRLTLGRYAVQDSIMKNWESQRKIILGADPQFVITGSSVTRVADDDSIEITDAAIDEKRGQVQRRYQAKRAVLEPARSEQPGHAEVRIEVYNVTAQEGQRTMERARETLGPAPIALTEADKIANRAVDELLAESAGGSGSEVLQKRQADAREWIQGTYRRIVATINERTAFTFSVLVLVLLGAGLGIVFRGAHAATAFGISFVPSILVIVLIVTGKQMAQNESTFLLGLSIMWLGIVVVGVLDFLALTRWVRR